MYRFVLMFALAAGFVLAPVAHTQAMADAADSNIISTLQADGSFSVLLSLFDKADLTDALEGGGPFILFAPPDSAFASQTAAVEEMSEADLTNLLSHHLVMERLTVSDAERNGRTLNVLGESLACTMDGGTLYVDGIAVVRPNIEASNGVIHVIGSVLTPPVIQTELDDGY